MQPHTIVSREEWIAARKAHLAHEKEYTKARERLNEERRALPWVKVDKNYVFDGPDGKVSLADLFKGRSQLVVQHFMFAPDWNEACKSCSFWADGFERMIPHLAARDTTMVADLARAAGKARRVQAADGLDVRLALVRRQRRSTTITAFRSRRSKSSQAPASTISAPPPSGARKRRASACSIATRPGTSSTPIPASRAAST